MSRIDPHLIYFADAMCSWCWGFAPVTEEIERRYGERLPIRLIVGGLRPGTTDAMTDSAKEKTRAHWEHVQEASGQPFDFGFFERASFVYDSHPAARAVVAVRNLHPARTMPFFRAVQHAFYALNADVTRIDTLSDIARANGCDAAAFLAGYSSADTDRETWTDYAISQKTGVTGFPTLIAGTGADNRYTLITQGYQRPDLVLALIESWRREVGLGS